jgi:hypothetical protein
MSEQGELLPVEHVSLSMERLKFGDAERVYLAHWQRENDPRRSSYGHGLGLLGLLLRQGGLSMTRRDAVVAADVVQWLGTNCGHGFVRECEREIGRLDSLRWRGTEQELQGSQDAQTAQVLAAPFAEHPGHRDLVRGIVGALHGARADALGWRQFPTADDRRAIRLRGDR